MTTETKQGSDAYQKLLDYGRDRGYKLDWMTYHETFGSELDANEDRGGVLLQDADQGKFADVPNLSENFTAMPRGAVARADAPRNSNYRVRTKADVWLRNASQLYEEAVQRQWSSATDIPWHTLEQLPDDIERAECELATFLTDVEFVAGDVPGKWIADMSPDYYEPRMFLVSQIMDEARHMDVFRKRALANGIGLLQAGPGAVGLLTAESFIEMTATLHLVGEGFIQSMFRMGELFAHSEMDKRIFRLAAQDESRHVAFGVMHMKHLLTTEPERREEIHTYLDRMEGQVGSTPNQSGLTGGGDTSEALAILLGGGKSESQLNEGYKKLMGIRRRQFNEYVHRLDVVGLGDRRERLPERIRPYIDPPRNGS